MKKIAIVINWLIFSPLIHAVDYTQMVKGPKTFEDGDTVTVSSGTSAISDSSSGGAGIQVNNNGAINVNATGTVSSVVNLSNKVANDLGKGSSITSIGNALSTAVRISGAGTSLTAADLTVDVQSKSSNANTGFNITQGASVYLTGHSTISVTGTGVQLYDSATNKSSFTADQVNIEVAGTNSAGVHTEKNTEVDLGDGSLIKATGSNTVGVQNYGGYIKATNLTIVQDSSAGSMGKAMDIRGTADIDGGSISSTKGNGVSVYEGGTFNYQQGAITTSGNGTYGLLSQGATSTANLDNVVFTINGFGYALWATGGGGKINANDVTINVNDTAYALVANNQGKVTFTGDTVINTNQTGVAMVVDGNGSQVITGVGGSKMTINGGLYAQNQGLIDLTMQQGSYLKGLVDTSDDATSKLALTGSTWDMTSSSRVSELTANQSTINFLSTVGDYQTLEVGKLAGGNARFNMQVDLGGISPLSYADSERVGIAGVNGDLLTVKDSVGTGRYQLAIANNGSAATQGNEVLQVVATPNNNTGNFSLTSPVEAGAYEYGLRQSTDGNGNKTGWELYSQGQRTSTAEAATSFLNTNYLLSYVDTQTLLQRMGDLRSGGAANKDGNLWVRGFGGKLNSFGGQQLNGFDMTYSGTQLGIDKQLDIRLGQMYIGVMAGMTHANPDYRDGDGTTKDYHVGLYGTLMMDNGVYVDAVAKYTYLKNHFSVKDTQGNSVQGKGSSSGYNVSLETGKRFKLAAAEQSGFYVEPQAQLTYGHQGGMSIKASNGLQVDLGNYNYTLGRVSGVVGYDIAGANPINIYVKSGYVREMEGGTSYTLNSQKSHYNARGGWWDSGIGVNAQINKRHNIFADINYAKGSRFDQQQLNLGYRYTF